MGRKAPCPTQEQRINHQDITEELHGIAVEILGREDADNLMQATFEASVGVIMLVKRNEEDCPGLRQYIQMHMLLKVMLDGADEIHEQLLEGQKRRIENSALS